MQHLFGLYTPDAQPLILRAVNSTEDDVRAGLPRLINTPLPEMSLLRLTWDHDDEWAGEYAARLLGAAPAVPMQGLVCFRVRELPAPFRLLRGPSPTDWQCSAPTVCSENPISCSAASHPAAAPQLNTHTCLLHVVQLPVSHAARPCWRCLLLQTVLAGTGYLNRQMAPLEALPYRQAVVRHIGLQEPPQTRPVVTILNKQVRHRLLVRGAGVCTPPDLRACEPPVDIQLGSSSLLLTAGAALPWAGPPHD